MTREGLSEEVTFTLTPQHEKKLAMRTFEEVAFQAEDIASAETGPRLGFREVVKRPMCLGVLSVGKIGGRGQWGYIAWNLETRARSLDFIQSVRKIFGEFKAGK